MHPLKTFRDVIVVCTCLYVVWTMWADRAKAPGKDAGEYITNLYNKMEPVK